MEQLLTPEAHPATRNCPERAVEIEVDLKDRKIRVNAVSPGMVVRPGFSQLSRTEEQRKRFIDGLVAVVHVRKPG